MARASGIGPVVAAVVQRLRATAAVTAIVAAARVVDEVPEGLVRPYIAVSLVTEADDDTLSLGGVDDIVSVQLTSEYRGADEIGRMATAVRESLDGQTLAVAGFSEPADVTYEQSVGGYKEDVAGVVVRHQPMWFRVRAL